MTPEQAAALDRLLAGKASREQFEAAVKNYIQQGPMKETLKALVRAELDRLGISSKERTS